MALPGTKDGKPLYAVALNVYRRGQWHAHPVEYTNATDAAEARANVVRGIRGRVDIIAVGPAIGFFVEDNHGKVISAE